MQINIQQLQATTKAAIETAKRKRRQREAETKAKDEQKQREMQLKAEGVLAQIPDRCQKEAEAGRHHANVYSLHHSEYNSGFPYNKLEYNKLKGAGAIIWNACQQANLKPTLEHWHDGVGLNSGFNIVVHWEEK